MKSVQSQQSIVIHVSVKLQLLLKTLQRNLNSQQQKTNKQKKQSYGFITFTLRLWETQSITPSYGRSPHRTCSAIWEPCQKECPSTGVTVCVSVWIVMFEAMLPTETIKSTATASGRNKEPFFSHYSATFGLSKSQKTRTADKGNLAGCGTWRENELRKSWFSLPDKPAAYLDQKTKSI